MALWLLCSLSMLASLCLVASSQSQALGKSYIVYLGNADESLHPDAITDSHYSLLGDVLGSDEAARQALIYSYRHAFSGFAARLTDDQVSAISRKLESGSKSYKAVNLVMTAGIPDVVSVFPSKKNKRLHTTDSWDFLGLTRNDAKGLFGSGSIWTETKYGEDVIIGSLDTGVWPESASFSDHSMGPIPKKWRGTCEHGDAFNSSHCNRYFYKGYESDTGNGPLFLRQQGDFLSPRDSQGHGTHTSSIATGRFVTNANLFGFANGTAKGGAPRSRIAIYKVGWTPDEQGNIWYDADVIAAFDMGIHDGVDVFTLSLGSELVSDYFQDPIAIGAFHAVQKGIVVVCSAGNSGPNPETIKNGAPWVITVGASSVDRNFSADVILGNNATYQGQTLSELKLKKEMYPLISSADAGSPSANPAYSQLCLAGSLDADKVKGKIVACLHGENTPAEKGLEVLQAGGAGMIVTGSYEMGADLLPAAHVSARDGQSILAYINSTRFPVAYIFPGSTKTDVKPAPAMASFSSRGPNSLVPDILKPDITAPGVNILAAFSEVASPSNLAADHRKVKFNVLWGTSMSCPHVAAIAALLKSRHPDWSPAAIKSAIVTTGYLSDNTGEPILSGTPFSFGGGHVNPNAAADPGLVYDATPEDFTNFLCGLNYNQTSLKTLTSTSIKCPQHAPHPSNLNYPSIAISNLRGAKTITRHVTNVGEAETTYRVTVQAPTGVSVSVRPSQLKFKRKGVTKSFQVKFKVDKVSNGDWVFGNLTWNDQKHSVTSPIAVKAAHI